jgi:NodT family efflux transporter outer membrane factor (OMF) lipoprotein
MKRVLSLVLAAAPLVACAGAGPVRAPDVSVPARFEAPPAAQAAAPATLDRWWILYGDPELQRLVERALVNAPDAKTANARLVEARAQRNANLRLAYPTGSLNGNASDTYNRVIAGDLLNFPGFSNSGSSQSYGLAFDVSWEVDLFGRVRQGRRLVESDYAANRFNIEGTRASLAASVADSLFAARGLAIQLADAQETARIRGELNSIASRRAERGLSPRSDVERTASDLAQAQAQATQAQADLQAARRQLLLLVGDGVAPLATLPIEAAPPGTPPAPPATVPGELLQRRPDVREAEMRLAAAISQYKIDQLELFPKFTLKPGIGITRSDQPSFSSTTARWTLGAGMSVPVLDRPRLKQLAKVSGARAEEAVIAYEKTVQTAYAEAENALVLLASDDNRVAILAAGEAQARSAYLAARTRYDAGLEDLNTTLSTEQAWRAARTALTAAQVQALRRSVQTFKALGGGWTPPPGGAA